MTQRLSASSAGRIMACPASANLDLAIPGWQEPARDDTLGAKATGTSIHAIVEQLVGLEYTTATRTTKFAAKDMLAVGQLLTYIGELWSLRRFKVLSEETVRAVWLKTEPKTTADLVFHTQDEIHVLDVKWGKIPVEAHENEQLLYYAACYGPLAPKAKGVRVHIAQPRANNMDSWFITADRLKQFMDEARAAEDKILAGDTTFGPSHHCTFCPANPQSRGDKGRPLCPPLMQLHYPKVLDEDAILDL